MLSCVFFQFQKPEDKLSFHVPHRALSSTLLDACVQSVLFLAPKAGAARAAQCFCDCAMRAFLFLCCCLPRLSPAVCFPRLGGSLSPLFPIKAISYHLIYRFFFLCFFFLCSFFLCSFFLCSFFSSFLLFFFLCSFFHLLAMKFSSVLPPLSLPLRAGLGIRAPAPPRRRPTSSPGSPQNEKSESAKDKRKDKERERERLRERLRERQRQRERKGGDLRYNKTNKCICISIYICIYTYTCIYIYIYAICNSAIPVKTLHLCVFLINVILSHVIYRLSDKGERRFAGAQQSRSWPLAFGLDPRLALPALSFVEFLSGPEP